MIEIIVNKILDTDLIGTNPSEIKIYEFYSPRLKPLAVWQQVMFEEVYTKKTNEGLVNKILKLFRIYSQVEMWNVNKPSWSSVSKPMQDILTKLDGGLI